MADGNLKDLQRLLMKAMRDIPEKVPRIIQVQGLNFIKKNFRDQGFNTGSGLQKWKARKDGDTSRALLTGHASGGNKLRNSFRTRITKTTVEFFTYKDYAEIHNQGGKIKGTFGVRSHKRKTRSGRISRVRSHSRTVNTTIDPRPFMKPSRYLDNRIKKKITKTLDQRFNK